MKKYKDSQLCSLQVYRMTTSIISTSDGIIHCYQQAICPHIWSWKDCTSQKLQNSAQRQTVLALYDQETARNKGKPNYWQLKTALKLHIDKMMRTRNFRVRIDGDQWKAIGQCSKGDSCSFSHHRLVQGELYGGERRKGRSSSPAPNSKAKTDGEGEKPQKSLSDKKDEIPCTDVIENSEVRMSRYSDTSTKTQMAEIMVQYGRSSRSSWTKSVRSSFGRTNIGKAIRGSSNKIRLGKVPNGECSFVNGEKGFFLSVYVDEIRKWQERNTILSQCGRYSWKTLIWENRHHSLTMFIRVVLNENVK